jgi:hypothetical protein
MPSCPNFRIFWTIFGCFFTTITIPHPYISYTISLSSSWTPEYPILCPCPCLSPCPLFSLFWHYLWTLFCYYHLSPSLLISYHDPWRSYSPWISCPNPLPLPVPLFSLFEVFMGAFLHIFLLYFIYICIYMICIPK